MVILELKSPVTCACDVRMFCPNLHVEVLVQEPSMSCVIELDEQLFWRNCELKIDIFASEFGVTHDWVVKGLPIMVIVLSHKPGF